MSKTSSLEFKRVLINDKELKLKISNPAGGSGDGFYGGSGAAGEVPNQRFFFDVRTGFFYKVIIIMTSDDDDSSSSNE